jgi:hypothetical protein
MPVKKPIRMKRKPSRATKSGLNKSRSTQWWTGPPAIAAVAICLATGAVLIAAHQPSDRAETSSVARTADTSSARSEVTAATPLASASTTPADTTPEADSVPDATPAPVTITGCLERADETFRLKDTAGANAPKARNWRSGFLKKGSASIEVIDAPRRLNLPNHVGQRVSVTGMLVDREMHVRSLQRVSASCSSTPKVKI